MLFSLRAAILRLRKKQTRCAVSIHRAMRDYSSGCARRAAGSVSKNCEPQSRRRPQHPATAVAGGDRIALGVGRVAAARGLVPDCVERACSQLAAASAARRASSVAGSSVSSTASRIHRSSSTNSALMLNCRSIVLRIETATWRRGHHIVPLISRIARGCQPHRSPPVAAQRFCPPQTAQRFCNEPRGAFEISRPRLGRRRFGSRCARRPNEPRQGRRCPVRQWREIE